MTSKKSSVNKLSANYDFKFALKNLAFPSILSFIIAANMFVVEIVGFIANYIQVDNFGKVDIAKTFALFSSDFSIMLTKSTWYGNIVTGIIAICVGVLFALFAFAFLMKKNRVNMFLSSPVDRRTIFKNRVLASVILMAGSSAIPIIADIALNVVIFKEPLYVIWHGVLMFAEYFVYMLVGFSFMSISMLACNTIVESLFFGAGILWLPTVAIELFSSLAKIFLRGYSYSNGFYSGGSVLERSIFSTTSILNPILFGKQLGDYYVGLNMFGFVCRSNVGGYTESSFVPFQTIGEGQKWAQLDIIAPMLIWAVVGIGLLFVARALLFRRKAENAGIHATANVPTTIFAVEAGMVIAALCAEVFSGEDYSNALRFFVTVIALVIGFYITSVVSKRKIKLEKSAHIIAASSVGAVAVLVLILATGGLGYTSYAPKAEDVKLAAIQSNIGEISGDEGADYGALDNELTYMLSRDYWSDSSYCLCQTKDDIQKLIDLSEQLCKKTDDMRGPSVSVVYVLNNGKKVERRFKTTDFNTSLKIISLTDTEEYKSKLENLMLAEKADCKLENLAKDYGFINTIGLFEGMNEPEINYLYNNGKIKIITNDIKTELYLDNALDLRQAIYTDKMSVNSDKRFRPTGNPVCQVIFYDERSYPIVENSQETVDDSEDAQYVETYVDDNYGGCISNTIRFYIDDSMTNTINFLKSVGIYDEIMKTALPDVQSVTYLDVKSVAENIYSSRTREPVCPIFNSSYKTVNTDADIQWADDEDGTYINQLGKGAKSIDDAQKAKELYAKSRSFARISDDDYIAVFTLKDGTEISRLIYSDMMK